MLKTLNFPMILCLAFFCVQLPMSSGKHSFCFKVNFSLCAKRNFTFCCIRLIEINLGLDYTVRLEDCVLCLVCHLIEIILL